MADSVAKKSNRRSWFIAIVGILLFIAGMTYDVAQNSSTFFTWFMVLLVAALSLAALANLLTPQIMIRWQYRSTLKRNGPVAEVGRGVQLIMGYQTDEPWKEAAVRRRVRFIGIFMLVFVVLYALALPFILKAVKP